jgi:hypothetical protein
MNPLPSTKLRRPWMTRRRRSALSRFVRRALYVKLAVVVVLAVTLGVLYVRLAVGPMSFGLTERVAASLADRIGAGWTVALRDTALQLEHGSPALRTTGLEIRNPEGAVVMRAPDAIVSVDGMSLLTANLQPRSIEFRDLQLRATLNRDGSLSFAPTSEPAEPVFEPRPSTSPAAPPPAYNPTAMPASVSPVSVAVGSLLDLIVGPAGILGALDRAQLTNARLVLIDADQKTRATFNRVDATFSRTASGGRSFEATLDGPRGVWRINGEAILEGSGYRATMTARDAPVQDLLLLSGLSAVPATSDLKLSGRVDIAYFDGRVVELKVRLDSNSGAIQIDDKDTSPLPVDIASIEASWDEGRRTLALPVLELKGGATHVRLHGELVAPPGEPGWRAALSGEGVTLTGAAAGDPPVRIDRVEAALAGQDALEIKSLSLRGPNLTVDVTGAFGGSSDARGLKLDAKATKTDARSALRLWPEAAASKVRRYLVESLRSGTVDMVNVHLDFTGADLARATHGGPVPDQAVRIDFKVANGKLAVTEGLPPLSRADVSGVITGAKTKLRAPAAMVEMGDGHSLAASDGSFQIDDVWRDNAIAQIGFRLQGGADGIGALLQAPLIREIAAIDVDPAAMKGRADLRIAIPLAVNNIPKFADLPLTVSGTVTDLSADKIFGKDRLEGTNLTVAYDTGNLQIKGEGKLSGSPVSIDVRRTREGGGEANVSFVLDEAARARRGFAFGSQLSGPLPLKASVALTKTANAGTRIEIDFSKASVDQLIPGWVKPVGKPGKLTFVLSDLDGSASEIKDLQLESGPVLLRGSAVLSADGNIDKADLTTFKLSPGDDMRVQIERTSTHYKVAVRGNVGDARPFTKIVASAPSPARTGTAPAKESKDFDLDLSLNIFTGYNDEAITNASIKASVRKESLRQLDMKGRLGATDVTAQTLPRPGGNSVILMQADDAGGVLRFLDIYRRMAGGELSLQMNTGNGPQSGLLTLRSFALRNEPALRRIIPTQTQVVAGRDEAGNLQPMRIDVNEVNFTKARVDFTRSSGRIDFKDAAIWGNQVGFTLGGFIDYSRDRTDISGTFVPAYGLNNVFAQVPLFGPLLGGGQYEGLFAVNFRVSGPASAPLLTVNPLSAVAPGFLRKLFGAAGTPETGALPNPPPER